MARMYVLWASKGPIEAGDLNALKARAEKLVAKVVGQADMKWERVEKEKVEDGDLVNRLSLHRRNPGSATWINLPYFIDEVPVAAQRIEVGLPENATAEMIRLLESVVEVTRRDQARVDAELMRTMSDRAPTAPAPKGGTTSRAVYASAANMLHPDGLGWSLNLPDHLKEGST